MKVISTAAATEKKGQLAKIGEVIVLPLSEAPLFGNFVAFQDVKNPAAGDAITIIAHNQNSQRVHRMTRKSRSMNSAEGASHLCKERPYCPFRKHGGSARKQLLLERLGARAEFVLEKEGTVMGEGIEQRHDVRVLRAAPCLQRTMRAVVQHRGRAADVVDPAQAVREAIAPIHNLVARAWISQRSRHAVLPNV